LLPEGFIGFANLSLRLRVLEKELNLGSGEFYWLNNNRSMVNPLWNFLKAQELANNDMVEAKRFAVEIIVQMILNPDFAIWGRDFIRNNPNVTLQQFGNWFMGSSEGQDGEYDASFWENPNLTFQQQNLPKFSNFLLNYPSHTDALYTTPSQMFNSVGGMPLSIYNANPISNGNTCAIRVSKALNYSGVIIPNISGKTFKGADNKYYFLGAANLMAWMKKTFGIPTGSNHLTGAQGGTNGVNFPTLLQGKEGIYILIPNNQGSSGFSASGHADLFFANSCDGGCYFGATGGVKEILFWELK
ncbi:hypothetical protein FNW52_20475, partial [Flavobacterium sp. ZT3R18]|uniref:T6SS effector amidase Tae4 family protein n=1 Tax=Flavobacterium sp. ZT3R18 TaxID=2594429 RepID=UPI001179D6F6